MGHRKKTNKHDTKTTKSEKREKKRENKNEMTNEETVKKRDSITNKRLPNTKTKKTKTK